MLKLTVAYTLLLKWAEINQPKIARKKTVENAHKIHFKFLEKIICNKVCHDLF
jgi:hypothetical protein